MPLATFTVYTLFFTYLLGCAN